MTIKRSTIASDMSQSIFPRKIPAVSQSADFSFGSSDNPNLIALHKVTGCFNSVVQISSKYCLAFFQEAFQPPMMVRRPTAGEIQKFITSQQEPFDSEALNELSSAATIESRYTIGARLSSPKSIEFSRNDKVKINYLISFYILKERSSSRQPLNLALILSDESIQKLPVSFARVVSLGSLSISIVAAYGYDANAVNKSVSIYVDFNTLATHIERPTGDLKRFYDHFFPSGVSAMIKALAPHPKVSLTPTLSLVGQNPLNEPVPEMPEFEVTVFLVEKAGRQALVAAFNVMPGNRGFVEDIPHFIGDTDYGLISDEYLVQRLMRHKWNKGLIPRLFPWRMMIEVEVEYPAPIPLVESRKEMAPALLYGNMVLDNLDDVVIEPESNTRSDYIRLYGLGHLEPFWLFVYTEAGTYQPDDINDVDLGDTSNTPWGLYTRLELEPIFSSDSLEKEFQKEIFQDAYSHIVKPFALPIPPALDCDATYIRIEGVTKQVFILAQLKNGEVEQ